jgi:hypothetical protein
MEIFIVKSLKWNRREAGQQPARILAASGVTAASNRDDGSTGGSQSILLNNS